MHCRLQNKLYLILYVVIPFPSVRQLYAKFLFICPYIIHFQLASSAVFTTSSFHVNCLMIAFLLVFPSYSWKTLSFVFSRPCFVFFSSFANRRKTTNARSWRNYIFHLYSFGIETCHSLWQKGPTSKCTLGFFFKAIGGKRKYLA